MSSQWKAYHAVRNAVASGALIKPGKCDQCGADDKPKKNGRSSLYVRHYAGYENPLTVKWLCHRCHRQATSENGCLEFIEETIRTATKERCVIWPFSSGRRGYAKFKMHGKTYIVSRFVCNRVHGAPPEDDYEAAHSCGKGHLGCINPHHLSWKTAKDNQADKIIHGTDNRGEKNWNAKLTESDVLKIRAMKDQDTHARIAAKFGVPLSTISSVISGRSWRHVEGAANHAK